MKLIHTNRHRESFRILGKTRSLQAAVMTLPPGESTGDPDNEHPDSEQWLLVLSGTGRAKVGRRTAALKEGSLLVIEKGEKHQVKNIGRKQSLVTLNFYAPPAYKAGAKPRVAGIRSAVRALTNLTA
jgi:mannose-6-phosphate isomerase-like protein (cupin superfamily)